MIYKELVLIPLLRSMILTNQENEQLKQQIES